MPDEYRHNDEKIVGLLNSIDSKVKEIYQRQTEIIIPEINNMKHTLYGNNKPGLCSDMSELRSDMQSERTNNETRIEAMEKDVTKIGDRFWYLIGGFILTVLGYIATKVHLG